MNRLSSLVVLGAALLCGGCKDESAQATSPPKALPTYTLKHTPDFCGENAYVHCAELCKLGPRPSGSDAYEKQLQYITRHLEQHGWAIRRHSFTSPHGVKMTNLHALFAKEEAPSSELLLTCHIDTKINIPDDFVGADDGASGAAVLMELARLLSGTEHAHRIELVFFDGEEAVAERMTETDGLYGSKYDVERRGDNLPRYMINLDMVGARNKTIQVPLFDSSPELVDAYLETIKELKLNENKWTVTDQEYWDDDRHFREAGVATINLICDFVGSIWWHTPRDNMSRICPKSLQESGLVTLGLLRRILETKAQ
ncbi:MAG: M28 family peptidase [Akkermansia sp.]|nr:M28 family peptidase [Akkermansia sp.]